MDPAELVARARVVALPMRERFRGIDVREALLIAGNDDQWVEWSPFVEYEDAEAATWLRAALEALGGPCRSLSEGEARDEGPPAMIRVNATVPAVPPEAVPGILARFPGCRTAKVKVAERGQSLADDLDRVAAVRDVLGPTGRIRVDANGLWSLDDAEVALRALGRYDLEYAEQPVASVEDLARLRRRIAPLVPIAADESIRKASDPHAVLDAEAADVLILKFQPLGGLGSLTRILDDAIEADIDCVTSSALETSVGLGAAAAFARYVDDRQGREHDHGLGTAALLASDVTRRPLLPIDGAIEVRAVVPDADLLDRYAAPPDRAAFWLARLTRCIPLARQRPE